MFTFPTSGQTGAAAGAASSSLERRLELQRLVCQLSGDFINLPAEEINEYINYGLSRLARFLGFNVAAVCKFSGRGSEGLVTHIWTSPDLPPIPPGFTEKDFPWVAARITQGSSVHLADLDALPREARTDRDTYERFNARSVYNYPMNTGSGVIGCLALVSIGEARAFPDEYQEGIQLFVQTLASALARERAAATINRALAFERLLFNLSSRLLQSNAADLDAEIERGLWWLADFFEVDRSTLWLLSDDGSRFTQGYSYARADAPEPASSLAAADFPWLIKELAADRAVRIESLADYPPEAERERLYWDANRLKSALVIPLLASDRLIGCCSLLAVRRERFWTNELVQRLRLAGEMFVHALGRKQQENARTDELKFEMLLSDLSSRFINLPAAEVDRGIEEAQRRVCECLGFDLSTLWQWSAGTRRFFTLTHLYRPLGGPPLPDRVDAQEMFPWSLQQLIEGRVVVMSSTEDTPTEAARDRELWRQYGVKSGLSFPLSAGGGPLIGALSFNTVVAERVWPEAVVKRLQLVAQIFANALTRQRFEQVLRESEERFRNLTANLPGAIYQFYARDNGQRGMAYVDSRVSEVCGLSPEPLDTFFERFAACVAPEDRARWLASIEEATRSVQPWDQEVRFIKPTGEAIYLRGSSLPQRLENEVVFSGVIQDLTERRRAVERLKESEQRFHALVEQAGDGFELLDDEGRYLDANAATLRQLGYTREELLRLTVVDIAPSLDRERFTRESRMASIGSPVRVEGTHRRKDGSTFPVEVTISRIELGGRALIMTLVRDVTERKRREEELRKSYAEIKQLKDRLQAESDYLRTEIKVTQAYGDIIGQSRPMKKVLHQVEQVAPTDSSVLIRGETGTGKELIAEAIHGLSPRKQQVMVKVNCAALPAPLVESELFGREKGAFTGALARQVGRFEIADNSTIFLDEVGELSLDVQAKLLRVLQEGRFERLGSPKTLKVNIRLIAATNRDLAEDVRKGRFREDLYYRLNVFPIEVPPLRERVQDIPMLVWAFVEELSNRMGRKITKVPRNTMEALQRYSWPGNIRELRNVIERSVIISRGDSLRVTLLEEAHKIGEAPMTLAETEREHIIKILEKTGWRIKGPNGAATRLALKPSTLYTRMQKLGIPHRRQKDGIAT